MTQIRDPEDLINFFVDAMKADLNDCITAMNNRKGDTLLNTFSDDKYFRVLRKLPNFKSFINVWLDHASVISNRASSIQVYNVFIDITSSDDFTDNSYIKALRYTEVLKRVIEKNAFLGPNDVVITETLPFVPGDESDPDNPYIGMISSGIKLETSYG